MALTRRSLLPFHSSLLSILKSLKQRLVDSGSANIFYSILRLFFRSAPYNGVRVSNHIWPISSSFNWLLFSCLPYRNWWGKEIEKYMYCLTRVTSSLINELHPVFVCQSIMALALEYCPFSSMRIFCYINYIVAPTYFPSTSRKVFLSLNHFIQLRYQRNRKVKYFKFGQMFYSMVLRALFWVP